MSHRKPHGKGLPVKIPEQQSVSFSLEFYDNQDTKYCLSCWGQQYIREALLALKEMSTKSFKDLQRESRVRHFGEVIWEKTTEKDGFPDPRVNELPAFHFSLVGVNNQKARVYGAYQAGIFYIVWFDLEHIIWPSLLKHT